ncbi:MAG: PHP domain-containing protein [Firmicutes bacterium]|nr:PHP domain-containing protein [Bacillota bacterium]
MADYTNLKEKIARGEWHFDLERGDYHNHTWYSDGTKSPAGVVAHAKELGLREIAITDHDGIGGIREAQEAGAAEGIDVVPGVELSTRMEDGTGLHILGYGIDIDNEALNARLEQILEARMDRNYRLVAALQEDGYEITMEEIMDRDGGTYVGKPNIARTLVAKGYVESKEAAFIDIFRLPKYKAIKKERLDPVDGIKLILTAGGLPVWAHAGKTKRIGEKGSEEFYGNVERILDTLIEAGLEGMECYYPLHDEVMTERFLGMAKQRGLIITKGSDYHGDW